MKEINETTTQFWETFLDMGEKYREKLSIPQFAHLLFMFTAKMCIDTAPSLQEVKILIDSAVNEAIKWSKKEQGDEQ